MISAAAACAADTKWFRPCAALSRWPVAHVSTRSCWSAAAPSARRMVARRLTNCGTGSSNWQMRTRRGAGMGKPMRSAPAASDKARLATSSDLPTLGSPPTNRMPCGGSSPGSTRQAGAVDGCCSSNCASDRTVGFELTDFLDAGSLTAAPPWGHPPGSIPRRWTLFAKPQGAGGQSQFVDLAENAFGDLIEGLPGGIVKQRLRHAGGLELMREVSVE